MLTCCSPIQNHISKNPVDVAICISLSLEDLKSKVWNFPRKVPLFFNSKPFHAYLIFKSTINEGHDSLTITRGIHQWREMCMPQASQSVMPTPILISTQPITEMNYKTQLTYFHIFNVQKIKSILEMANMKRKHHNVLSNVYLNMQKIDSILDSIWFHIHVNMYSFPSYICPISTFRKCNRCLHLIKKVSFLSLDIRHFT